MKEELGDEDGCGAVAHGCIPGVAVLVPGFDDAEVGGGCEGGAVFGFEFT